nr:type VII secretion protein EccE [Segniliparus rugosus]
MSTRVQLYRPPAPGTFRLALVSTLVVAAVFALCRRDLTGRWAAASAGTLALALSIWWRGLFATDIVGKRLRMLSRRFSRSAPEEPAEIVRAGAGALSTVALELVPPASGGEVPVELLAGYLDRYGVSCSSIRITLADKGGSDGCVWASLTLSAADNLAALAGRSPRIPLRETAETARRRLADHLRELGWQARAAERPDGPDFAPGAKEGWRAVADERGYLAAYRVRANAALPGVLRAVRGLPASERWVALELAGAPRAPRLAVVCALRTGDKPAPRAPLAGLEPCSGEHLPVLRALRPQVADQLGGESAEVTAELLGELSLLR